MMNLSKTSVWRLVREQKILRNHRRVAAICSALIASYKANPVHYPFTPKKAFETDKIIWQYWATGFEDVPPVVRECLQSVEQYASDYQIVRLTDDTIDAYLDIPAFLQEKRAAMSAAHFADVLRLMLLRTYGGIWMDATILLTKPIPAAYADNDFFMFRRDPAEPDYRYWRNVYAYYFGWAKGFRVNVLNSFIVARKDNPMVADLCDLLLLWWKDHDEVPDYFFFQILFDVYDGKAAFPLVSDTLPHYLQQALHDPAFHIMAPEAIRETLAIHKLTYK